MQFFLCFMMFVLMFFLMFLIIAARAPGLQHRAFFRKSIQYGNATRLQADDGSDRGHARVLLRWAEVPVESGDRRRRASSPFCTDEELSKVLPPRNLVVGASRDTQHQQHQHVDEAASQRVGSTAWMPTSTAKRSGGALRILGDATEPECVP